MSFSFKNWYDANGERLNQKRMQRYQTDPEYREKVLAANKASRDKRRVDTADKRREEKRAIRAKTTARPFKTVNQQVGDSTQELFTIGALALALGCSIQAIRIWEKEGIIPATPLRSDKGESGDRLYTQKQIKNIKKILVKKGHVKEDPVRERPRIKALFRTIRRANGRLEEVPLFLIGALSQAVCRNVVTLEQLESRGCLPRTPFRASSVGRRLYTAEMIEAVKDGFERYGDEIRGEALWKAFHDDVLKQWTALGVIGAVLVEAVPKRSETANAETEENSDTVGV
jgi:DNA-binding transcriptional MerR regulator